MNVHLESGWQQMTSVITHILTRAQLNVVLLDKLMG